MVDKSTAPSVTFHVNPDILILGAGVSGLACARELSKKLNVLVLEGRNRVDGRILTHRSQVYPSPIDLGPEFIHGRPKETLELLEESRLLYYDLSFRHFEATRGKPKERPAAWDKVEALLERLNCVGKRDCSFKDFLTQHAGDIDAGTRKRAISYIEGFNAARYETISVQSILKSNEEEEEIESDRQHRLIGGYDQLAEALARSVTEPSRIELNTVIRKITWSKGRVTVLAQTPAGEKTFHAKKAVVTLPLSVLQQSPDAPTGVRFEPELPTRRLLQDKLAMGNVLKIVLHCRTPFWEEWADRDLSFIHAMDAPIPVWWTTHPLRTTLLTGWVGGSKADVRPADRESLLREAIASLAQIFHVPPKKIAGQIKDLHTHDWKADPFSLGSYSYVAVGGANAPHQLARPIDNTLYFAGEHTHTGLIGTVAGAIQTGYRAAKEILRR